MTVNHKRASALIQQHNEADAILGDRSGRYTDDDHQNAAATLLFTSIELGRMGYRLDAGERWFFPVPDASTREGDR